MKYVALDTETTGVHREADILTVAAIVYENEEKIASIDLKIKSDSGIYSVDPNAMLVNKIDLAEHNNQALTKSVASQQLRSFLQKYSTVRDDFTTGLGQSHLNYKIERLVPVGSKVQGDIQKIREQLVPNVDRFLSHKVMDTCHIAEFLIASGVLEPMKTGLGELCQFFDVEFTPHVALSDAEASMKVFQKLRGLVS